MDLAQQSDVYVPSVGEDGTYIDSMPSTAVFQCGGIRCMCGSRKDKVYLSRSQFATHTKSKTHQNWLRQLFLDNSNYYAKVQELEKVVQSQKVMIGRLEIEVKNRDVTIQTLIAQYTNKNVSVPTENLLEL
jgi:hypothetical protein